MAGLAGTVGRYRIMTVDRLTADGACRAAWLDLENRWRPLLVEEGLVRYRL